MNLLTSPLLRNPDIRNSFHAKYLDTGALISFSSTSRDVHAAYRKALMMRMAKLFNLTVVIPESPFDRSVFTALTQKIVDETNIIEQEMATKAQSQWMLDVMKQYGLTAMPNHGTETTIARRKELFTIASALVTRRIPISWLQFVNSPEALHFLISCGRRWTEQKVNQPKVVELTTHIMGRLLVCAESNDGYLADWFKALKDDWPRKSASQQVDFLVNIAEYLRLIQEPSTHPTLPIIRDFVSDQTSGWADDAIRKASSFLIESRVEGRQADRKMVEIVNVLQRIGNPSSRCTYVQILQVYCRALNELLNVSSNEKIDTIIYDLGEELLRTWFTCLEENRATMSAHEQIAFLYAIGDAMGETSHPLVSDFRALIAKQDLSWAHPILPQAYAFVIETWLWQEKGIAKKKMRAIVDIFAEMYRSSSLESTVFDIKCRQLSELLECTTQEEIFAIENEGRRQLFLIGISKLKQSFNGLSWQEQAQILYTIGEALYYRSKEELLPLLPAIREFFADDTLVWAKDSMRRCCSFVVETRLEQIQGILSDEKAHLMWQFTYLLHEIGLGQRPLTQQHEAVLEQLSASTLKLQNSGTNSN